MINYFKKPRNKTGFSFTLLVIAIFIGSYAIYDYHRLSAQVEKHMINSSLAAVATLQSVARADLKGRSGLSHSTFQQAVKDTCFFTKTEFFGFVNSSNRILIISRDKVELISDSKMSYEAMNLSTNEYKFYYPPGKKRLILLTRLDLDKKGAMGLRTVRFYKLLFGLGRNQQVLKSMRFNEAQITENPIIIVSQSTQKYKTFFLRSAFRQILFGIIMFILISAFIYVSIIRRQQKTIYQKLKETRELNDILNKKLRYSDRLAVFGRLSAAMAHELRNPLGSIRGFTQLFKKYAHENNDQKLVSYGDTVISEIDRLNSLISSMLNYSSPIPLNLERCSLAKIIDNVTRLISRDANAKSVKIKTSIQPNLSHLILDENLITQTLMNLLLNAVEAMQNSGEVTIKVSQGAMVGISISDTGVGIAGDVLEHIFEPFFTTKPSGTGLGLATVEKIITEHGGTIRADSEIGQGSTFLIELPIKG